MLPIDNDHSTMNPFKGKPLLDSRDDVRNSLLWVERFHNCSQNVGPTVVTTNSSWSSSNPWSRENPTASKARGESPTAQSPWAIMCEANVLQSCPPCSVPVHTRPLLQVHSFPRPWQEIPWTKALHAPSCQPHLVQLKTKPVQYRTCSPRTDLSTHWLVSQNVHD